MKIDAEPGEHIQDAANRAVALAEHRQTTVYSYAGRAGFDDHLVAVEGQMSKPTTTVRKRADAEAARIGAQRADQRREHRPQRLADGSA